MVPVKAVPVKNGEDETSEEESELEEEPKLKQSKHLPRRMKVVQKKMRRIVMMKKW
jgi:hypothetical protein